MSRIRTFADIEKLDNLTPAEEALLENCHLGEPTIVGEQLPSVHEIDKYVRAEILRYLLLGGCTKYRPDETGVQLMGAFISGVLDLAFADNVWAFALVACQFEDEIILLNAELRGVTLSGTHIKGLNAQSAKIRGNVLLRNGFLALGRVSLSGAQIGGQLACDGARFKNKNDEALYAEGAEIKGDVFLRDGFLALGEVSLSGAQIEGRLDCEKGHFEKKGGVAFDGRGARIKNDVLLGNGFRALGKVSLLGAQIEGRLDCEKGRFEKKAGVALDAQGAEIKGGIVFIRVKITGDVVLISANTAILIDDVQSLAQAERVFLYKFTYQIIYNFKDVEDRLVWLAKDWAQDIKQFSPQPYMQLAKVLAEMGHRTSARKVLLEKERLQRAARRARMVIVPDGTVIRGLASAVADIGRAWLWSVDMVYRLLFGYRRLIFNELFANVLVLAAILIFLSWGIGHIAWERGQIVPRSDVVLLSDGWQTLANDKDLANPAQIWSEGVEACLDELYAEGCTPFHPANGKDYESFSAFGHALDVVVPLIDFGQEDKWAPSKSRGFWGWLGWWSEWVFKLLGWIIAGLGTAALTSIVRNDPTGKD